MPYPTVADVRRTIAKVLPDKNDELQECLDAAIQLVHDHCNRPDGWEAVSVASARVYPGTGMYYTWIDECVEITAVGVKDSPTDAVYASWSAADWIPFSGAPDWPDFNRKPYVGIMTTPTGNSQVFTSGMFTGARGFRGDSDTMRNTPTVEVTAKWGNSLVLPATIKRAIIIQAARYFKRGESAYQDAVGNADTGGMMMFRSKLDADVLEILENGRHVRPPIGR